MRAIKYFLAVILLTVASIDALAEHPCGENAMEAPSDEIVMKGLKIANSNASNIEIVKRLKPYEDSFRSRGDKAIVFPIVAKITWQDGSSGEHEDKILKRHTDDEWYVHVTQEGNRKIPK